MNRLFKILALIIVVWDTVYLFWLFFHVTGLGHILFFAELLVAALTVLLAINHWSQSHVFEHHLDPQGSVDIFIPTVNEPIEMVTNTVAASVRINYANKKIFLLDDGPRPELQSLAHRYNITYLSRDSREHYKAGNLNYGLSHSNGDYILIIDADHIVKPDIVQDLLGHFQEDETIAIVATRQAFLVPEADFNHDVLFYQHMMAGKNADNAAISCGNGAFYRRTALNDIGGFQTWNLVEDLYTSYILHQRGYTTVYINQPYSYGTAPTTLRGIYQQRGTWSLDTLRLLIWHSPLWTSGLTLRQRLHYLEIGFSYVVSAVAIPLLFVLPALAVLFNDPVVTDPRTYLLLRVPSLLLIIYFYYKLSGDVFSQMQLWASLFPVYLKALFLAIIRKRIPYQVTNKISITAPGERQTLLVLPHIAIGVFSIVVIVWRVFFVDHALTAFTGINLMWMTLMLFWFAPIIQKGFERLNGVVAETEIVRRGLQSTAVALLAVLMIVAVLGKFGTPTPVAAATAPAAIRAQLDGASIARLDALQNISTGIHTYGSTGRLAAIPCAARARGLSPIAAGAYLNGDPAADLREIDGLKANIAAGCVDIAVIGSNATSNGWTVPMLTKKVSELKTYAAEKGMTKIKVTIGERFETYRDYPELISGVDVIFANVSPFYEGTNTGVNGQLTPAQGASRVESAVIWLRSQSQGKEVMLGETGWPTGGPNPRATVEQSLAYLTAISRWTKSTQTPMFVYSLADEPRLAIAEPHLSHFGLYNNDLSLKPAYTDSFINACKTYSTTGLPCLYAVSYVAADAAANQPANTTVDAKTDKSLCTIDRSSPLRDIVRWFAIGTKNSVLRQIPIDTSVFPAGKDTDADGLPNALETAIGTNINSRDTDRDGYDDLTEVTNNYSPLNARPGVRFTSTTTLQLAKQLAGRMLLQVQDHGELWFVRPTNLTRRYLKTTDDIFAVACGQ